LCEQRGRCPFSHQKRLITTPYGHHDRSWMDGYMLREATRLAPCPPWRIDADGTSFFSEDFMGCPQVIRWRYQLSFWISFNSVDK
jgi:hypothetical protein